MSHLLIFGATGKTGRRLLTQGLEQGHNITAFVRNPAALAIRDKNLTVLPGNISDPKQVSRSMTGQDAVISVLGSKTTNALWRSNTVISSGLKNILAAMREQKVKRLLFVTSFGVSEKIFLPEKLFIRLVLKNIFADIPLQEKLIRESGLDWTIIRPARLTDEPGTAKYKAAVDLPITPFSKISRSDVADFLLKSLQDKVVIRKIITLSYF